MSGTGEETLKVGEIVYYWKRTCSTTTTTISGGTWEGVISLRTRGYGDTSGDGRNTIRMRDLSSDFTPE